VTTSTLEESIPADSRNSKWPYGVPWQVPVSGIVSLVGLGISAYLTVVHYGTPGGGGVSCPITTGAINCEKVITSPQSVIFGLPVAAYGLIWHFVMFIGFMPWAWRTSAGLGPLGSKWARPAGLFRLGAVLVAIGFVVYLITVEVFQLHLICLWCTSVHVTTFILLITVISSTSWSLGQGWEPADTN
jgi:uncharacterized membrane protein